MVVDDDALPQTTTLLIDAIQRLSLARTHEEVQTIVKHAARRLVGSDGCTFVLRDGDQCHYVDEDAIEPLWRGQRFPLELCISGWAMLNSDAAVIPDIYADPRIPHEAYRPTFVQSLVMVPIRTVDPVGAIGSYWAEHHVATDTEIAALRALADSTAVAMENVSVYRELEDRVAQRTAQLERSNRLLAAEVEQRREAEAAVRELALTDALTGLRNRRGFELLATQELKLLSRAARPGVLLFADIDGMKTVNDALGHECGDRLLVEVSATLSAACRDADVVARVGGDELAVFVPEAGDPQPILARIDEAITVRNTIGDLPFQLALSLGAAVFDPIAPSTLDDLLAAADAAMYATKRSRRRVDA